MAEGTPRRPAPIYTQENYQKEVDAFINNTTSQEWPVVFVVMRIIIFHPLYSIAAV